MYATTFQGTFSMSRLNEGTHFPDRRLLRLGMALGSAGEIRRNPQLPGERTMDTALAWNYTLPSK